MATIGPSGRDVPALTDAADAPAAFEGFDRSGVPILIASSPSHAAQRVAEFRAAGGIEPALIWRKDVRQLHHHPNTGAAGETAAFLAGQQAGVDLHMAGSIPPRTNPLTVLTSAQFGAVGAGITWDGQWLTFAQGGMLVGKLLAVWGGGNVGLERTVTTLVTSGGEEIARAEGGNEDRVADVVAEEITAGTRLRVEAFHQAAENRWLNVRVKAFFTAGVAWTKFL